MRDANRIPEMMQLLAALWRQNPDMRLGQLVEWAGWKEGTVGPPNAFYLEDDVVLENMKDKLRK